MPRKYALILSASALLSVAIGVCLGELADTVRESRLQAKRQQDQYELLVEQNRVLNIQYERADSDRQNLASVWRAEKVKRLKLEGDLAVAMKELAELKGKAVSVHPIGQAWQSLISSAVTIVNPVAR